MSVQRFPISSDYYRLEGASTTALGRQVPNNMMPLVGDDRGAYVLVFEDSQGHKKVMRTRGTYRDVVALAKRHSDVDRYGRVIVGRAVGTKNRNLVFQTIEAFQYTTPMSSADLEEFAKSLFARPDFSDPEVVATIESLNQRLGKKVGRKIQTLIFDRKIFPTRSSVKSWASKHGFKSSQIDETTSSWRVRQNDPGSFVDATFRTISLRDGVKAVVALPKNSNKEREMSDVTVGKSVISRGAFDFGIAPVRAYKDAAGNPHVIAIASDTGEDSEKERFSSRAVKLMADRAKTLRLPLQRSHRDTFEIGYTTNAAVTAKDQLEVDFELNFAYPEAVQLYDEVARGVNTRQLSVGGRLNFNENKNAAFVGPDGVKVLDDMILEHVAITRENEAANPRTGFLAAISKSLDESGVFDRSDEVQKQTAVTEEHMNDKNTPGAAAGEKSLKDRVRELFKGANEEHEVNEIVKTIEKANARLNVVAEKYGYDGGYVSPVAMALQTMIMSLMKSQGTDMAGVDPSTRGMLLSLGMLAGSGAIDSGEVADMCGLGMESEGSSKEMAYCSTCGKATPGAKTCKACGGAKSIPSQNDAEKAITGSEGLTPTQGVVPNKLGLAGHPNVQILNPIAGNPYNPPFNQDSPNVARTIGGETPVTNSEVPVVPEKSAETPTDESVDKSKIDAEAVEKVAVEKFSSLIEKAVRTATAELSAKIDTLTSDVEKSKQELAVRVEQIESVSGISKGLDGTDADPSVERRGGVWGGSISALNQVRQHRRAGAPANGTSDAAVVQKPTE